MTIKGEIFKYLSKINFLNKKDYYKKLEILHIKRRLKGIVIDIGSACNSKCPFCPRQQEGFKFEHNSLMNEEVFNTIFEQLKNIKTIEQIFLYAFGEPLLNKNAGVYIKKLKELNKKLILSTNTTNMENFTDELMELDVLQFSIEGWDKESYETFRKNLVFEETLNRLKEFDKAVKERRAKGLSTPERVIHCLITKDTNIEAFINLWAPYVDKIKIDPMYPYINWENEKMTSTYYPPALKEKFFHLKHKINQTMDRGICYYIKYALAINADGKVVLCCSDFSHHLDLGDYRDIKKAFNNKITLDIYKKMRDGKISLCDGCTYSYNLKEVKSEIKEYFPILKNIDNISKEKGIEIDFK